MTMLMGPVHTSPPNCEAHGRALINAKLSMVPGAAPSALAMRSHRFHLKMEKRRVRQKSSWPG